MRSWTSLFGPTRLGAGLLSLCCLVTCQSQVIPGPKPVATAGFPTPVTASRTIGLALLAGPWKSTPYETPPLRVVFNVPLWEGANPSPFRRSL